MVGLRSTEGGQAATAVEGLRGLPALWRAFRSMYAGSGLIEFGIAGGNGGFPADAKIAQKSASAVFSIEGKFAGRSVEEVATALRNGRLHPSDIPVEYVVRDGHVLIHNTRSADALQKAGIPRFHWNA